MEHAKSLGELEEQIKECPFCKNQKPPLRSVAVYRAGIGQVFLFSCVECHKPILCGVVEQPVEVP
jgi:hypothetical protein